MSNGEIRRTQDYLGHIVEAIDRIHRYVEDQTGGMGQGEDDG